MSKQSNDGWSLPKSSVELTNGEGHQNAEVKGNPYRREKPKSSETILRGKFYLANEKGSYGLNTTPVFLVLCREYLWVSETLSIPLSAITDTGLTSKGGFIRFWDAISGTELVFNFTKLGFLRFKRNDVEALLARVCELLPKGKPNTWIDIESAPNITSATRCEVCGAPQASAFVFYVFRSVGIAPIAYSSSLTPLRFVLCDEHAKCKAMKCSARTALAGYLGLPGVIAGPWYVVKNLLGLRRARLADAKTVGLSILCHILLPWAIMAGLIGLLVVVVNSRSILGR
jgi:hypothetical protein